MKIPASFNLFAEKISVFKKQDLIRRTNNHGETHARFNEIYIDGQDTPEIQEQTFYHELTHTILQKMGEEKLRDNEKFVWVFSGLLNQALKGLVK